MSAQWKAAFRHGVSQARRCGLEVMVGAEFGDGDAGIGAPWVTSAQAMKKLVWSRTLIEGGQRFIGLLPRPPSTSGPFQDTPYAFSPLEAKPATSPEFYADAAVVAYRVPNGLVPLAPATITSSAGSLDASLLGDEELKQAISLPTHDGEAWVKFSFGVPQTVRSLVFGSPLINSGTILNGVPTAVARLEALSSDGSYRKIAEIAIDDAPQVTASFAPVTSREFRVVLSLPPHQFPETVPPVGIDAADMTRLFVAPTPKQFLVSELSLHAEGRVNEFERKAGFSVAENYYQLSTPHDACNAAVALNDIVILTDRMTPDGRLDWTPPPGTWVVFRFGYSLTGAVTHVVPPERTGLEVDKLDDVAVRDYMGAYLRRVDFRDSISSGRRNALFLDSIESGPQNWTKDILEQFTKLRGYDARPWMPALTGVIVQDAEASDEFLWDFRRTLAQLLATRFYGEMAKITHEFGGTFFAEALEDFRPVLGDDLEMRSHADQPMGAMWAFRPPSEPIRGLVMDERGAASVAHVYGKAVVMAESFTNIYDPIAYSPRDLKPIADLQFDLGINRLLNFGVTRDATWADDARGWVSYLTRSSFLLQQGHFVADVAYFYGEETPLTALPDIGLLNDVPTRYAYDFVNGDALLRLLDVSDGELVTPSGMHYRALQLGGTSSRMTLPVLLRIKNLVEKGATVVGAAPAESPSLIDDARSFESAVASLWEPGKDIKVVGKGMVVTGNDANAVLAANGVVPDFESSLTDKNQIVFVHRKLHDGDLYFLNNRSERTANFIATFRVSGKVPELWHADTGERSRAPYSIHDSRTSIPVELEPWGAVFVVLRKATHLMALERPTPAEEPVVKFEGPWRVDFGTEHCGHGIVTFDRLESWSTNPDAAIKYFSGTATYLRRWSMPAAALGQDTHMTLDLGEVRDVAEVIVNGKSVGTVWHEPYRLDVMQTLRPGLNTLEIRVTNLWVNRLIGDAQAKAANPCAAFVDHPFTLSEDQTRSRHMYKADAPLRTSGLIGPVVLYREGKRFP
jgi:hypothetical protein